MININIEYLTSKWLENSAWLTLKKSWLQLPDLFPICLCKWLISTVTDKLFLRVRAHFATWTSFLTIKLCHNPVLLVLKFGWSNVGKIDEHSCFLQWETNTCMRCWLFITYHEIIYGAEANNKKFVQFLFHTLAAPTTVWTGYYAFFLMLYFSWAYNR